MTHTQQKTIDFSTCEEELLAFGFGEVVTLGGIDIEDSDIDLSECGICEVSVGVTLDYSAGYDIYAEVTIGLKHNGSELLAMGDDEIESAVAKTIKDKQLFVDMAEAEVKVGKTTKLSSTDRGKHILQLLDSHTTDDLGKALQSLINSRDEQWGGGSFVSEVESCLIRSYSEILKKLKS